MLKKIISIHIIPFILCFWYICSYILQAFPSNFIALAVIAGFAYNSFRNPANSAIVAVFLTPLTLSLGHHFEAFFGVSAPPYLPYAEIVLVSTLWGWVIRSILNRCYPWQFTIVQKENTQIERLTLWVMLLWGSLAFVGIFPAMYRNLNTSPTLPYDMLAVKIVFAPVWGPGDEFFPITMGIRTVLAFWFVYYVQKMIPQNRIHKSIVYAFVISMMIVAAYSIIQFLFIIGYSKYGSATVSLQGTFHENEGFASFNLMALVVALSLYFMSESLLKKLFLGLSSLLFILVIMLSNSRSVILLCIAIILISLIIITFKYPSFFLHRKKEWISILTTFLLLIIFVSIISPKTIERIINLNKEYEVMQEFRNEGKSANGYTQSDSTAQGSSLSMIARARLWQSAASMVFDSGFVGVGTGGYYRMTGFPRYQALGIMENAHMYWLQLLAELGILVIPVIILFLGIPIWIVFYQHDVSLSHQLFAGALLVYWFCNVVGQSLVQNELMWYISIIIGIIFVGHMSERFNFFASTIKMSNIFIFLVISIGMVQFWIWSVAGLNVDVIVLPKTQIQVYDYDFDEMGHRYLKVGLMMKESISIPKESVVLDFRVCSIEKLEPQEIIKAVALDEYDRVISTKEMKLDHTIESLYLHIPSQKIDKITVLLTVDKIKWSGNIFKSNERELLGFKYYGYRLIRAGNLPALLRNSQSLTITEG